MITIKEKKISISDFFIIFQSPKFVGTSKNDVKYFWKKIDTRL